MIRVAILSLAMLIMLPIPSWAQWTTPVEVEICTARDENNKCTPLGPDQYEPAISDNGRFLCWQDKSGATPGVALHCARRFNDTSFDYIGLLENDGFQMFNVVTPFWNPNLRKIYWFDANPLVFEMYSGQFDDGNAGVDRDQNLDNVTEETTLPDPGEYWIGGEIYWEPDRIYTMVFTRRNFSDTEMNLGMAQDLGNGGWEEVNRSKFDNVNTSDLEYAPDVSCQGRQLTFTRKVATEDVPKMWISTRANTESNWDIPTVVNFQWAFNEAMSMRCNDERAYFHAFGGPLPSGSRIYTTRRVVW